MPILIDGKKTSAEILDEISKDVIKLKEKGIVPGLVTILIGENPASQIYVRAKVRTCEKIGIYGRKINLPEDVAENELLELIEKLNKDDSTHGILVQLPLPKHIDITKILNTIDPKKDVDGFHFLNISQLYCSSAGDIADEVKETLAINMFKPCTPFGIVELLQRYNIDLSKKEVVILGRSNIVGKPIAFLLMDSVSTLTICHSHTKNISEIIKRADVIIASIGRPKMVTADMVKEGATVIDVGINRTPEGKIVGDVDFDAVKEKAYAITPVPGGVGPMTIAMLLRNTVESASRTMIKN